MGVTTREFGTLATGEAVTMYRLQNAKGSYAELIDFGAILVSLGVPDREGCLTDVVLGYDNLAAYEENPSFFGATIGRNGNRIEGAKFRIGETSVVLAKNENDNNLHSGPDGFEKKLWAASVDSDQNAVTFTRISPDGENGFPGEMQVSVTYQLDEENRIHICYRAKSDQDTVANFTNHSYFHLGGEGNGTILDHELQILAEEYTPVRDSSAIPTGECVPVSGTPMNFTSWKRIGQEIEADFAQLHYTGGYDHNYVTDGYQPGKQRVIANAYCRNTGIGMEVLSDLPCVQFYAGNFISGPVGKKGHSYGVREGFCLETQVEPNAVNEEAFHSPILKAGEEFYSETVYGFLVK